MAIVRSLLASVGSSKMDFVMVVGVKVNHVTMKCVSMEFDCLGESSPEKDCW